MSHQQPVPTVPVLRAEKEPSLPVLTRGHQNALDHLVRTFKDARPLAILIGDSKSGVSQLMQYFLAGIDDDVTVVRVAAPCADAAAGMRDVTRAIGFEPKDMSVADMENIFTMFLWYQRTHRLRTVVCIEETQDHGWWMLDKVRRLVEMETDGQFGLTVILSGQPGLNKMLNEPPLDALRVQAAQRIAIVPLLLDETREFIGRQIESVGIADVGQAFKPQAITLIHELCAGVPDAVTALCCKCLQLADEKGSIRVTTKLVKRAHKLLRLEAMMEQPDAEVEPVEAREAEPFEAREAEPVEADETKPAEAKKAEPAEAEEAKPAGGRLIARMNGEIIHEQPLNGKLVLIGRKKVCDICLPSLPVSRRHALIFNSSNRLKLLDLGSSGGTFVEGRLVKQHVLQDSDVIAIGDCTIEYVADDDQQS
jgi:type II secretory pathway predicted ATPase ExeA